MKEKIYNYLVYIDAQGDSRCRNIYKIILDSFIDESFIEDAIIFSSYFSTDLEPAALEYLDEEEIITAKDNDEFYASCTVEFTDDPFIINDNWYKSLEDLTWLIIKK